MVRTGKSGSCLVENRRSPNFASGLARFRTNNSTMFVCSASGQFCRWLLNPELRERESQSGLLILSRDPNHQETGGNSWFLKRTMAEKNGESTPRGMGALMCSKPRN